MLVEAAEERAGGIDVLQMLPAVFTSACTLYPSAVVVTDELCSVADAQDRQAAADVTQIHVESVVGVHTKR